MNSSPSTLRIASDLRPELLAQVGLGTALRDTGEPAAQRTDTGDKVFAAGAEAKHAEQGWFVREPGGFGSFLRELGPLLREGFHSFLVGDAVGGDRSRMPRCSRRTRSSSSSRVSRRVMSFGFR